MELKDRLKQLASMSLEELTYAHAYGETDRPTTVREVVDSEFLRRQTEAQIKTATATRYAAWCSALSAAEACVASIAAAVGIWRHL